MMLRKMLRLLVLAGSSLLPACCGPLSVEFNCYPWVLSFQLLKLLISLLSLVEIEEEQTPLGFHVCEHGVLFIKRLSDVMP